jgi:hypothetical protein
LPKKITETDLGFHLKDAADGRDGVPIARGGGNAEVFLDDGVGIKDAIRLAAPAVTMIHGTTMYHYRARVRGQERDPLPSQEWAHVDSRLRIVGRDACPVGIPLLSFTMIEGGQLHKL